MSNERKTGWATITHKDGSSVTGKIKLWHGDRPVVKMLGEIGTVRALGATITYIDPPMPALPTQPGSVIETGDGVRFFLSHGILYPWTSSIPFIDGSAHDEDSVIDYCRKHGGFTVIAEGK